MQYEIVSKHFYRKSSNGFEKAAKAQRIVLIKGMEFFVDHYRVPHSNEWEYAVRDAASGIAIAAPGEAQREAIENAKRNIRKFGHTKVIENSETCVRKSGLSPRYRSNIAGCTFRKNSSCPEGVR